MNTLKQRHCHQIQSLYNYAIIGIIHKSLIESQIPHTIQHRRRFRACGRRTRVSWQCRGWIFMIALLSITVRGSTTTIT